MHIKLKFSPILFCFVISVHMIAILGICLSQFSIFLKIGLMCIPLFSFCLYVKKEMSQSSNRIVLVMKDADNQWCIVNERQELTRNLELLGSYVSRHLVILKFKGYRLQNDYVPIVFDMLDHDTMRKLRVYLRQAQFLEE